ncbi:L-serine ammonia-lyase, iron-sulfur-dependent, subunit alpha [Lachnotalea glycerini]|uniref:L-serine dehydratase n=1 Tax=Lachnotalea glycerini TaxID=1763509 RepID=A0A371JJF0_9FIRM|nr:L-serine ammonia-lyase, iron-sulfur-dependent, subunit alpha [Lachnotalea glycerini]RDY32864.1 L-serine ammonia-lyase, iron-sulfur-dependent, subunit alpha [Lachnotalea glycerini]
MSYHSIQEILQNCKDKSLLFWETILEDDINSRNISRESSMNKMQSLWDAMLLAGSTYDKKAHSASGLVGGDGGLMEEYYMTNDSLCGNFISKAIAQALQMGESNACMKRIVAAPTAGACGVLPAVLLPLFREKGILSSKIIEALYVAAGIGQIIAQRAYIAGALGGCQAEIGSASAMAAGALVHIKGGDSDQIANSVAMALKNLLGLVCDPVAGLVEVPCVKRNVIGAVNALAAADMALAGIRSKIPADQVIDAMKEVGDSMDASLRETGKGGVAGTPKAQEIVSKLLNKSDH